MEAYLARQRTIEADLRESEERYRLLFQTTSSGFALHEIILDDAGKPRDYRFLEVNPAFTRLTGLKAEDLIGRTVLEVMPGTEPYWIESYGRVALTGESVEFDHYSAVLGRHYDVRAYSPSPGRFAVVFHDLTEQLRAEEEKRKLEEQVQQAQKMESLGVLAGGIAHDFNNILMAVLGHAELALAEISPMSPARRSISEITTAAHRAAELCRQMLAYAGKASFALERVDLRNLVEEMAHLLKTAISKKAILNLNLEQGLAADPGGPEPDPADRDEPDHQRVGSDRGPERGDHGVGGRHAVRRGVPSQDGAARGPCPGTVRAPGGDRHRRSGWTRRRERASSSRSSPRSSRGGAWGWPRCLGSSARTRGR